MEETETGVADEKQKYIKYGGITLAVLIIIALAITGLHFLLLQSGIDIFCAVLGCEEPTQMLIIGPSSQEALDVLNQNPSLVGYRIKTAVSLERNPKEQLMEYDIVLLDQSEQADKEVSLALGRAIEEYVKTGGSFILVKDSGIRRPDAPDVIGWKNTFRDIVPITCERKGTMDLPSCINPVIVRGTINREDYDHEIMGGIEIAPAEPGLYLTLTTFDVTATGNEIAYIEEATTRKTYPAIVEKKLVVGKSIYFNYNPGKTPGILAATIEYLK